jgi:hypothetical protein
MDYPTTAILVDFYVASNVHCPFLQCTPVQLDVGGQIQCMGVGEKGVPILTHM